MVLPADISDSPNVMKLAIKKIFCTHCDDHVVIELHCSEMK